MDFPVLCLKARVPQAVCVFIRPCLPTCFPPSQSFYSEALLWSLLGFPVSSNLILQLTFTLPCVFIFVLCLKIFPLGVLALKYLRYRLQSQWNRASHASSEDKWKCSWHRAKSRPINLNRMQCVLGRLGLAVFVDRRASLTFKQKQTGFTLWVEGAFPLDTVPLALPASSVGTSYLSSCSCSWCCCTLGTGCGGSWGHVLYAEWEPKPKFVLSAWAQHSWWLQEDARRLEEAGSKHCGFPRG